MQLNEEKMKCPVCGGKMEKKKDVIKEDDIEFDAYKCIKCGEELMNMRQLHTLANKICSEKRKL